MEKEKLIEIFNRIDQAINSTLTKRLCKNFIDEWEFIKRSYLGES